MACLISLLPAAGHDQLWFLLMSQRWLHGGKIYGPALFDSNPPLIVWLSGVPVWLGEQVHFSSPAIGKLLVLLAALVSATLSVDFLSRLAPISRLQTTWLALAYMILFTVAPARDFGQRDHLTALLCLPYVLGAAMDYGPVRGTSSRPGLLLLRYLAGALAAIGICLKSHQALIPVAVELTLLLRPPDRSKDTIPPRHIRLKTLLRPEPRLVLLFGGIFLFLIRQFTPVYFTLALPTLRDTYWAIGHLTPLQLLAEAPQLHILAAISLTLFVLSSRRSEPLPFRPAIRLLLAAAGAATAAYYIQGTGWYYQQLPAISLFGAALALQLLDLPVLIRLPAPSWLPRVAAALAVLAIALTAHFTGYPFTRNRSFAFTSPDPAFFAHLPPGTPVAIITTSVDDAMMPIAGFQLFWAQRTNNVWTLPAILRSEDPQASQSQGRHLKHAISPSRLAELDRQQHTWMTEDLNRWRPQLVLVARCQQLEVHCQELEDRHDDLLAWFKRDPAFRSVWARYRYTCSSGDYDAYTLKGEPSP